MVGSAIPGEMALGCIREGAEQARESGVTSPSVDSLFEFLLCLLSVTG